MDYIKISNNIIIFAVLLSLLNITGKYLFKEPKVVKICDKKCHRNNAKCDYYISPNSSNALLINQKINIYQANAGDLATIDGISKNNALKIVQYLSVRKPPINPQELLSLAGIGRKKVAILQEHVDFTQPLKCQN